jgi:hypothetical protein
LVIFEAAWRQQMALSNFYWIEKKEQGVRQRQIYKTVFQ